MHEWLCNVFDDDGDIVVPSTDRFIVGCSDESPILVDEGNCVHRP